MPQNYNACFPATTPPTLYTSTGTTTTFATGFPSLKQNDIVVFTGDNTTGVWTQTPQTDYAVNSQNANNVPQVVFTSAPGTDVLITRRTDLCVLVRNFQAGQSIRAQDLNNAFLQQLYLHQEMYSFLEQQFGGPLIPDGSTLQDTFWNKTTDTITSGEAWISDDAHIVTTLAGDNRWLNTSGADLIGGPGITTSSTGSQVTIEADLTANGGLEFSGAGNDREIRVDDGNGIVVNANGVNVGAGNGITVAVDSVAVTQGTGVVVDGNGVHAGITSASVAQTGGNNDNPAIRISESLNGGVTNTDMVITGGNACTVTRNSDAQLTIDAQNDNTTYDLTNANVGGNSRIRLAGSDGTNDDITVRAGLNISFSQIDGNGFTINSTGGGGGAGGSTVVANIPDLNTAGTAAPAADSLFLVIDSTGATAAAGAAPGNILAINDLPETPATGGPQGGYGLAINLTVQYDAGNTRWQFIRWQVQDSDSRYVLESGDTMTGPLVMDDTTIQITEGTDTLTLSVPALTGDHTITFPDADGEVALAANIPGAANNGQINIAGGAGLVASGDNATANQAGNTTRTLAVGAGTGITVNADDVQLAEIASNRVLGNSTGGNAVPTAVQVSTGMIANDAVTYAKMQNVAAANRVLGSTSAGGQVSEVQITQPMISAGSNAANRLLAMNASNNGMVWVDPPSSQAFPSGTRMLFNQTAAPTGWTKQTGSNNVALRVVSGNVTPGGSDAFTTVFSSSKSTGATTLDSEQIASHRHLIITNAPGGPSPNGNRQYFTPQTQGQWGPFYTNATGGGSGSASEHNHSLSNFDLSYVDVIIAEAD